MRSYSRFIDPYIRKIKNNEVEHCKEQDLMIDNIVIPTLERPDVRIDDEKIEKGLSLQKYFPYRLIEWEVLYSMKSARWSAGGPEKMVLSLS